MKMDEHFLTPTITENVNKPTAELILSTFAKHTDLASSQYLARFSDVSQISAWIEFAGNTLTWGKLAGGAFITAFLGKLGSNLADDLLQKAKDYIANNNEDAIIDTSKAISQAINNYDGKFFVRLKLTNDSAWNGAVLILDSSDEARNAIHIANFVLCRDQISAFIKSIATSKQAPTGDILLAWSDHGYFVASWRSSDNLTHENNVIF